MPFHVRRFSYLLPEIRADPVDRYDASLNHRGRPTKTEPANVVSVI